ncbi:unnamed protein product [Lota lota]
MVLNAVLRVLVNLASAPDTLDLKVYYSPATEIRMVGTKVQNLLYLYNMRTSKNMEPQLGDRRDGDGAPQQFPQCLWANTLHRLNSGKRPTKEKSWGLLGPSQMAVLYVDT